MEEDDLHRWCFRPTRARASLLLERRAESLSLSLPLLQLVLDDDVDEYELEVDMINRLHFYDSKLNYLF